MNWERIAAELEHYRQAQRQRWGDLDDMTVAAYLADTCTEAERAAVERAMKAYPAVFDLVEGLRELFAQPTAAAEQVAGNQAAKVPLENIKFAVWSVVEGARQLADNLVVRVAKNGRLNWHGLPSLFATPSFATLGDSNRTDSVRWRGIPLEPFASTLSLGCRYLPSAEWEIQLTLTPVSGEPDFFAHGVVKIENESTDDCELQLGLREWLNQPIYLGDGRWRMTLSIYDYVWRASLELSAEE
jgi:hypothetical protein